MADHWWLTTGQARLAGRISLKCAFKEAFLAKNVEIKARLENFEGVRSIIQEQGGLGPMELEQRDVFFKVPFGRLKLRQQPGKPSELIFYLRPNQDGPKTSRYWRFRIKEPQKCERRLQRWLGKLGEVNKTRELWMIGQTRVHLDQLQELGHFLEFEVVLKANQSEQEGQEITQNLLHQFGIEPHALCQNAYVDLLSIPKEGKGNPAKR